MKFTILAYFKRLIAAIIAFFMSIGASTPVPIEKPAVDTVESYNEQTADAVLKIGTDDILYDISDLLFGLFFEDINFGADGGLYAEMVANRSFEYTELAQNDALYAYSSVNGANLFVETNDIDGALNINNPSFVKVSNETDVLGGIQNRGFLDGMSIEEGKSYNFSVYAKSAQYMGNITVRLVVGDEIAAENSFTIESQDWQKYELSLTSTKTAFENVCLQLVFGQGEVCFDMISLFPTETYKNRENGMRNDLALMLEEIEPKFLRFPGGCVIEGYDAETAYNWKDSVGVDENGLPLEFMGKYGDVAGRKQGINLWTDIAATDDPHPCFMSYGLGFFEYFQLAEDMGAIGVPVLNCGLFCQMRGRGPVDMNTPEFEQYVQDMHDLIEFCRGDENSTWGKVRVSLGHEEPFELKYICIGNENEGDVYYERYVAFLESFNEAKAENPTLYEGIELIYSAGATDATHGAHYIKSYEFAKNYINENGLTVNEFAGATDQHYYNNPEWFLKNVDYYDADNYPRETEKMTDTHYGGAIGVFLGEYAARSNRLEAALAEAAFMTGLERNGDIVKMAAYAPLFGNLTATHWSPDLIWFNNHQVTGSISYYVQKAFSNHQGNSLLKTEFSGAEIPSRTLSGKVGVGVWYTAAEFDNVKVVDNKTGRTLAQDNFCILNKRWNWEDQTDNQFKIKNGKFVHKSTWMEYNDHGASCYFGMNDWENYTYTLDATKLDGEEGFFIPFAIRDNDNMLYWNIGGYQNTVSCLQEFANGEKTGQIPGTVRDFVCETGKTYALKIVVAGRNVKCYIDDELYVDFDWDSDCNAKVYQVVSKAENGDTIIKLVNVSDESQVIAIDIEGLTNINNTLNVYRVAGDSLDNDNILGQEEDCKLIDFTIEVPDTSFNYTIPKYSVNIIRISEND